MKKILAALAGLITGLGVFVATPAQAHHVGSISLYLSNASVASPVTFLNDGSNPFSLHKGYSRCCFLRPYVHVGPAHDIIVTSREYPVFRQRMDGTGYWPIPKLGGNSHLTFRVVPNGGA